MAWRANPRANGAPSEAAARPASAAAAGAAAGARAKPTIQAIAQIERNRENRRRAMAAAKKERERENQRNERRGEPGDVDFQRMIRVFREQNREKAAPHVEPGETKITICVRKRPVNAREVKKRDYDAVTCLNPMAIVHDCKLKVDGITKYLDSNPFNFDHTFDESVESETVYLYTAQPLVRFIFQDGGHATVFAYGQTGSGKTFTMQGIQKQIAADVFAKVHEFEQLGTPFNVCVSFFEIYGGRCQDLLHRQKLTIREDGSGEVQIVDLQEVQPTTTEELLHVIHKGNSLRTTHATEVNDMSSRSHCICQIAIRERVSGKLHGKLSLIDLAGSERGQDTKNHNRQRRLESAEINRSLLALKECFRALDSGGRNVHIPFRASKLTQVLKDSFVNAHARTVMIATVSPCTSSSDHTLNTLRYADRVKEKHVSANAFDGGGGGDATPVDVDDVQLETDLDDGGDDGEDDGMDYEHDDHDDIDDGDDSGDQDAAVDAHDDEDIDDNESDGLAGSPVKSVERLAPTRASRSVSASSEDIKILHRSLRRHSSNDGTTNRENEINLEALHGVVQTLYEEQESLLNSHMSAIQEDAELLTEEGALLAEIQGDGAVDYDIDRYVARLDQILQQKAQTISSLRKQLRSFRRRCEQEEKVSKKISNVPTY